MFPDVENIQQISPQRSLIPVNDLKTLQDKEFTLNVFDPIVITFFNELSKAF